MACSNNVHVIFWVVIGVVFVVNTISTIRLFRRRKKNRLYFEDHIQLMADHALEKRSRIILEFENKVLKDKLENYEDIHKDPIDIDGL